MYLLLFALLYNVTLLDICLHTLDIAHFSKIFVSHSLGISMIQILLPAFKTKLVLFVLHLGFCIRFYLFCDKVFLSNTALFGVLYVYVKNTHKNAQT